MAERHAPAAAAESTAPAPGPRARTTVDAVLAGTPGQTVSWLSPAHLKWLAALAAALVLYAMFGMSGSNNAIRYVTEPVTTGDLTVIVTATGSVQPTNKVDVSSELSGTIRKVNVDYNSVVKASDVLAELDTDKLRATVESSRAKVDAAKARHAEAIATVTEKERDLGRKKTLSAKQVASEHDLDAAQAAYDRAVAGRNSALADIGVAQSDLQLNETNLTKAKILSPIGGVVLKRSVDPGQTVASTLQAPVLFSIAEDLKKMELQVDVDEADVGKIKVGQPASFSVDAFPDRRFPATIRDVRFASETIQGVVTYKAVLIIDNSELLLRPGMTATAEIRVTEIKSATLVPNASLRYQPPATNADNRSLLRRIMPGPPSFRAASSREESGPNRTVHILKNGQPVPVKVVVGASDGKRSEIVSGELAAGQAVVLDQQTAKK